MIGDIRIIHISPEADNAGELLPHAFVLPDGFLALVDKRIETVLLNLLLAVKSESFLHFKLHRQSVSVPSGLSRHLVSLHGAISRNHILDNTGEDMSDMRLAVGSRRAIIKHICRRVLPKFYALFEDIVIAPKILDFILAIDELHIRRDFLVHPGSSRINISTSILTKTQGNVKKSCGFIF